MLCGRYLGIADIHRAILLRSEDSSYRGTPPWQLLQGLEKKRLILSDMEIADEDITVLVKFFQTKQVGFQLPPPAAC